MDGVRLHRLGKRLIDLSREVTTDAGDARMTAGEVAVTEDVFTHPDSTVSDICARTGFAQSHVSASVARLKERGLVETATDPTDRRRTNVHLSDAARQAIMRRASRPAENTIEQTMADPAKARRVTALLDELADLLL